MVVGYVFGVARNGVLGASIGSMFSCLGVLLVSGQYRLALCGVNGGVLCKCLVRSVAKARCMDLVHGGLDGGSLEPPQCFGNGSGTIYRSCCGVNFEVVDQITLDAHMGFYFCLHAYLLPTLLLGARIQLCRHALLGHLP